MTALDLLSSAQFSNPTDVARAVAAGSASAEITLTGNASANVMAGDVIDLRVACTTAPGISITVTDCNFYIKAGL